MWETLTSQIVTYILAASQNPQNLQENESAEVTVTILDVIWCVLWDLPFFENGARGGRRERRVRNCEIVFF